MDAGIRDEFRAEPADTDVVVGEAATLHCRSPRGEPEPRLRWLKDGGRLRTSERVMIDDQGALTIDDARREDAGSYVCVAWNIAGERQSAPAQLIIRGIYALAHVFTCQLVAVVASVVRRMNEVTLRRARLVLGWVTVFGRVYHHGM